jgi:hypothetical protein
VRNVDRVAFIKTRPITVTKDQLDQLEVRGYLDPDLRGEHDIIALDAERVLDDLGGANGVALAARRLPCRRVPPASVMKSALSDALLRNHNP